MELRYYQREAVEATWRHVASSDLPGIAVLPTGAGKSLVLAQLAKDTVSWGGKAIILAHVKELVEQNYQEIKRLAPELPVGIYSAGLGSRDTGYSVTVAGIQSVWKKAEEIGRADVILIDEAHRIPTEGEGQYRTFLEASKKLNPNVRLIGLTATPYRTGTGLIYGPGQLFEKVYYEIPVRKLIMEGYLCPLISKSSEAKADVGKVSVRAGEFVQEELQSELLKQEDKMILACTEIFQKSEKRRSVLVFTAGVKHGKLIAQMLRELEGKSDIVREVYGDTPDRERDFVVREFREHRVKYLVNVEVLTTGFNAPGVDVIAILRPTLSPGLHYQMIGRGLRKAPEKNDCLILDFAGNLLLHGPIDRMIIAPGRAERDKRKDLWKECPSCREVVNRTAGICSACGHKFEVSRGKHSGFKSPNHAGSSVDVSPLSEPEKVLGISYTKHVKKDAPPGHPAVLRVRYDIGLIRGNPSEFVCFEHTGYARRKAEVWWKARSKRPVPDTVDEALKEIFSYGILEPGRVIVESDGKYLVVSKALDFEFRKPIPELPPKWSEEVPSFL